MTPELKTYLQAWLTNAENDIISAQRLLKIQPPIPDSAGFHCQQAVEKCLKAFLCYKGKEVESTHSITYLLSECATYDHVFGTIDASDLNTYTMHGRSPDNSLIPDAEEASIFYKLAVQVHVIVKERIVFS